MHRNTNYPPGLSFQATGVPIQNAQQTQTKFFDKRNKILTSTEKQMSNSRIPATVGKADSKKVLLIHSQNQGQADSSDPRKGVSSTGANSRLINLQNSVDILTASRRNISQNVYGNIDNKQGGEQLPRIHNLHNKRQTVNTKDYRNVNVLMISKDQMTYDKANVNRQITSDQLKVGNLPLNLQTKIESSEVMQKSFRNVNQKANELKSFIQFKNLQQQNQAYINDSRNLSKKPPIGQQWHLQDAKQSSFILSAQKSVIASNQNQFQARLNQRSGTSAADNKESKILNGKGLKIQQVRLQRQNQGGPQQIDHNMMQDANNRILLGTSYQKRSFNSQNTSALQNYSSNVLRIERVQPNRAQAVQQNTQPGVNVRNSTSQPPLKSVLVNSYETQDAQAGGQIFTYGDLNINSTEKPTEEELKQSHDQGGQGSIQPQNQLPMPIANDKSRQESMQDQPKDDVSENDSYRSKNKDKWLQDAEQAMLESPTWKHRQQQVEFEPFTPTTPFDIGDMFISNQKQKKTVQAKTKKPKMKQISLFSATREEPVERFDFLVQATPNQEKKRKIIKPDEGLLDFLHYVPPQVTNTQKMQTEPSQEGISKMPNQIHNISNRNSSKNMAQQKINSIQLVADASKKASVESTHLSIAKSINHLDERSNESSQMSVTQRRQFFKDKGELSISIQSPNFKKERSGSHEKDKLNTFSQHSIINSPLQRSPLMSYPYSPTKFMSPTKFVSSPNKFISSPYKSQYMDSSPISPHGRQMLDINVKRKSSINKKHHQSSYNWWDYQMPELKMGSPVKRKKQVKHLNAIYGSGGQLVSQPQSIAYRAAPKDSIMMKKKEKQRVEKERIEKIKLAKQIDARIGTTKGQEKAIDRVQLHIQEQARKAAIEEADRAKELQDRRGNQKTFKKGNKNEDYYNESPGYYSSPELSPGAEDDEYY